jgi:hypothetical protein
MRSRHTVTQPWASDSYRYPQPLLWLHNDGTDGTEVAYVRSVRVTNRFYAAGFVSSPLLYVHRKATFSPASTGWYFPTQLPASTPSTCVRSGARGEFSNAGSMIRRAFVIPEDESPWGAGLRTSQASRQLSVLYEHADDGPNPTQPLTLRDGDAVAVYVAPGNIGSSFLLVTIDYEIEVL